MKHTVRYLPNYQTTGEVTVKPVLFACPLFREFRDLGVFAKITGRDTREYTYFIGNLLVQPVKAPKLRAPK